jgi:FkbM family methyltransferase
MPSTSPLIRLIKPLVPAGLRERLNPWRQPGRQLRLIRYEHFYRGSVIRRGGLSFKVHPHEEVGRMIYVDGETAGDEVMVLTKAAGSFGSFVDIGANIGGVSVPLAAGSTLNGLAVEPVGENFALLRENVRLNGLENRVALERAALGDSEGKVDMFLSEENRGDHRAGVYEGSDRRKESVELLTLASCLARHRELPAPYLIKIDVQGFEGRILAGAQDFLRSNECLILMEFWPGGLKANGFRPADIFGLLNGAGLKVYELGRPPALKPVTSAAALEETATRFPADGFCNLIATNRPMERTGLAELLKRPCD